MYLLIIIVNSKSNKSKNKLGPVQTLDFIRAESGRLKYDVRAGPFFKTHYVIFCRIKHGRHGGKEMSS